MGNGLWPQFHPSLPLFRPRTNSLRSTRNPALGEAIFYREVVGETIERHVAGDGDRSRIDFFPEPIQPRGHFGDREAPLGGLHITQSAALANPFALEVRGVFRLSGIDYLQDAVEREVELFTVAFGLQDFFRRRREAITATPRSTRSLSDLG